MANGFIKLNRSLLNWRFYKDLKTKTLFIHLLLRASYIDTEYRGLEIKRGQFLTSVKQLSEETGLSEKEVRNALEKMKGEELQIETSRKYGTIITITKYEVYQGDQTNETTTVTDNYINAEGLYYSLSLEEQNLLRLLKTNTQLELEEVALLRKYCSEPKTGIMWQKAVEKITGRNYNLYITEKMRLAIRRIS